MWPTELPGRAENIQNNTIAKSILLIIDFNNDCLQHLGQNLRICIEVFQHNQVNEMDENNSPFNENRFSQGYSKILFSR